MIKTLPKFNKCMKQLSTQGNFYYNEGKIKFFKVK